MRWFFPLVVVMYAQVAAAQDVDFARCIAALQERARAEQMPASVVDEVIPALQYQSRVIELDRAQPEFTKSFADYLNQRLTPERVHRGRQLHDKYSTFLDKLTVEYGVPGHYLIAFWGLETNFGSYLVTMPILDCLATLACDQRRSDFFTGELMMALALLHYVITVCFCCDVICSGVVCHFKIYVIILI